MTRTMLSHLALPILLCLVLVGAAQAGVVFFYDQNGTLTAVQDPAIMDPATALNALAGGPSSVWGAQGLTSAIPSGTKVVDVKTTADAITVDFSKDITKGLDEVTLDAIFKQVNWTLRQFEIGKTTVVTCNGKQLYEYLPAAPQIQAAAPLATQAVTAAVTAAAGSALTGKSMTLSPGHGVFWNGTGWYTQRPVYCSPLNQEDFHNLEMAKYLRSHLEADGMLIKPVREFDQSVCCYSTGNAWWQMASPYYLQWKGYPCTVYASYTGDCTLGSGASESNDDVRARPLASNQDNTTIYVSLHTNGMSGDCYGGTCPTGTITYYDLSSTEHKKYGTVSQNLANAVQPSIMSAIQTYADSTWVCNGSCTQDSAGNYGEIRIPTRAAILVELGFHDTCDRDADANHLRDNFFRSVAMWGIYKGVCDYFAVAPTFGIYSDEYVSDDIPATMAPGELRVVNITFRNRGVLWNEAHAFRLGAVGDSDPFITGNRINITGEVAPGDTYTFTTTFTAPATAGNYITDWQMVRDGYAWFGATITKSINVGGAPDTQAPTVPQNLQATAVSTTQVDLTWTASTDNVGVAGYKIFRGGVQIGTSTTTSYSDTTCSSNTTYSYTVSAYDASLNESAQSTAAVVTTPASVDFIIDNPFATFTGTWSTGTSSVDKYGADYRYIGTQATETGTATFTPNIEVAGNYDVYCWYPQGANRSAAAPYTVVWNGGQQTISVNQQANGGRWNLLAASKPFAAGTGGYVRIGNATGETGLVVMADAVRFLKVAVDTTPPVISNVASAPGTSTATITWTTDEGATSQVEYGLTTSYGSLTTLDSNLVTSHSVGLSGLARRTTYHYRVRSKDAANNEAISGDYTLRTR